jgi:hypothetical protein
MPLLQVGDFPEDMYKKIAIAARNQNRTIAQQVIVLLEKSLGQEQPSIERRRQLLERIRAMEVPTAAQKMTAVLDVSAAIEILLKREKAALFGKICQEASWIIAHNDCIQYAETGSPRYDRHEKARPHRPGSSI